VQAGASHLPTRVPRVAQSIGLVNTGPDQVSQPKEVEYLNQRTSTDTLRLYKGVYTRTGVMAGPGNNPVQVFRT
jgi:hypothetical protein